MSNTVRFLFDNYVDLTVLANHEVSSELPSFPVTNAFNKNRRSKVWRSAGYFRITALNSDLVFRETAGGPDLVASVAVAEYSSVASFLTALQTALNDAGASTYTVTQTSGLKIQIASNGSGGGGVLHLRLADVGSTIASVLGFDTVNLTGALTYVADEIKINTIEFVLWDMGMSSRPNSFAMVGPRNTPLKFSESSIIILRGNPTDPADWSTAAFSATLEYDEEVIAKMEDNDFDTQGYRYWRLEFQDASNPEGFIEVGAFFLGRYWEPVEGCAVFPLSSGFIDRTETITSEGGQGFSDILPKSQSFEIQFNAISKEDIEEFTFWFDRYGTGIPFFISIDSKEYFTSEFERMLKLVKFTEAPMWELVSPVRFNMRVTVKEEL